MRRDKPGRRERWEVLWLALCLLCVPAASVSAQVTHGPPRIRNVYIPADQLQLLFDSSSKGVLMPRDKVMALWREAQRHGSAQPAPPADVVLSQAAYEAQLDDYELRMSGRIRIAKLRGGWQTVDLPFGGVAIESAHVGGEPARFGRKDDGTLFLVLEKEGRFELELKMSAPLASKGGDLATTLKLPPVPASEVLVRLPAGKQLQIGETTLQSDGADRAQKLFRVAVDRGGLVPLVISERFAGGNRAPLVLANSRSTDWIEPAGLRWEVHLDLDVYARPTDAFRIQLPAAVDLAEVEAAELGQWTVRGQGDGTAVLALSFRKPFLGRRTVRLLGLAPIPSAKQWDLPTLKVLESASHFGQVSVYCAPSLRVEIGTLSGLRPERLSSPAAGSPAATVATPLEFAFWDENFKLPLHVTASGAVQGSIATLVEVARAGVALRSSVTLAAAAHPHLRRPTAVAPRLGSHVRALGQQTGAVGSGAPGWGRPCQADRSASRALYPGQTVASRSVAGNCPHGRAASRTLVGGRRTIP